MLSVACEGSTLASVRGPPAEQSWQRLLPVARTRIAQPGACPPPKPAGAKDGSLASPCRLTETWATRWIPCGCCTTRAPCRRPCRSGSTLAREPISRAHAAPTRCADPFPGPRPARGRGGGRSGGGAARSKGVPVAHKKNPARARAQFGSSRRLRRPPRRYRGSRPLSRGAVAVRPAHVCAAQEPGVRAGAVAVHPPGVHGGRRGTCCSAAASLNTSHASWGEVVVGGGWPANTDNQT